MILLLAAVMALQDDAYVVEVIRSGGLTGATYTVKSDGKQVTASAGKDANTEGKLSDEEAAHLKKTVKTFLDKKTDTHYGDRGGFDVYKYSLSVWYKKDGKPDRIDVIVFQDGSQVPKELTDLLKEMIDASHRTTNKKP